METSLSDIQSVKNWIMIESFSGADYSDPLDVIFDDDRDHIHLYEEIGSQGSLSNILGNSKPPKAPTPVLKRRSNRRPLAERSVNLPTPSSSDSSKKSDDDGKKMELRSRKDRFLFWKKKGDDFELEKQWKTSTSLSSPTIWKRLLQSAAALYKSFQVLFTC